MSGRRSTGEAIELPVVAAGPGSEQPGPVVAFPEAARRALGNSQLRRNLAHATHTIRAKRAATVAELPDWEELRVAGESLRRRVTRHLDHYLLELEESVSAAGGVVHWARDAGEANAIVCRLVAESGGKEVVKVKSLTTEEIKLNEALAEAGIAAWETDLAALIVQLAGDSPSHILVPAIHRNRAEIRELFRRELGIEDLSDDPAALAEAARLHLRERFLRARVAISGVNFAIAETGSVCVVESEGNGRMCVTLPETLISVMGVEKVVPAWQDLEVFLQLLPRSSTAERMNPYTSLWTGTTENDGPREFHLVLLDNGRTAALSDPVGRQALYCIRCSACLNVCPVYERTGGHAYRSVYPGPIGAILTPQLQGVDRAGSLPYASTLCGACFEVCPVRINIPEVLVHLRERVVDHDRRHGALDSRAERMAMRTLGHVFAGRRRYEAAQRAGRTIRRLLGPGGKRTALLPGPLSAWAHARELPPVPAQPFREWWAQR